MIKNNLKMPTVKEIIIMKIKLMKYGGQTTKEEYIKDNTTQLKTIKRY